MDINSMEFVNSEIYQVFLKNNPGKGYLKIRAYAASEALPVVGLRIVVSSLIDNQKAIFFDGITDDSGMVDTITLPAPRIDNNNLEVPVTTSYLIEAIQDNVNRNFYVMFIKKFAVFQLRRYQWAESLNQQLQIYTLSHKY